MKAVNFGAGNIGRGFVAPRLFNTGYEITFIDIQQGLIDELNRRKEFTVSLIDQSNQQIIKNVSALNSQTQVDEVLYAIQTSDVITTSIGPHLLDVISGLIAKGITARYQHDNNSPLLLIACENMISATDHLVACIKKHLDPDTLRYFEEIAQYGNCAVDCIVPTQPQGNICDVMVENTYEFILEKNNIKDSFLNIEGIHYVDDIDLYVERKLFTVNTGHAAIAYLGYMKHYKTVYDAIQDEDVYFLLKAVLKETGRVLIHKYNLNPEEHALYINRTIQRFKNPMLSDDIERIIRNPLRKIGMNDRIVQPSRLYIEYFHETPTYLAYLYSLVLVCDNERDPEVQNMNNIIQQSGIESFIEQISNISKFSILSKEIITNYDNFLANK